MSSPFPPLRAVLGAPVPASLRAPLTLIRGDASEKRETRPLPSRGVRQADYLIGGCRVLEAIDSRGNCVKRVRVPPDVYDEVPREWLAGYLERVDPQPQHHR